MGWWTNYKMNRIKKRIEVNNSKVNKINNENKKLTEEIDKMAKLTLIDGKLQPNTIKQETLKQDVPKPQPRQEAVIEDIPEEETIEEVQETEEETFPEEITQQPQPRMAPKQQPKQPQISVALVMTNGKVLKIPVDLENVDGLLDNIKWSIIQRQPLQIGLVYINSRYILSYEVVQE